jgi:hypothetical protein
MKTMVEFLDTNGLSEYIHPLITNGFEDMKTLHDIQEDDMRQMKIRLGYRRKLQRALATDRGWATDTPLAFTTPHPVGQLYEAPNMFNSNHKRTSSSSTSCSEKKPKVHPPLSLGDEEQTGNSDTLTM